LFALPHNVAWLHEQRSLPRAELSPQISEIGVGKGPTLAVQGAGVVAMDRIRHLVSVGRRAVAVGFTIAIAIGCSSTVHAETPDGRCGTGFVWNARLQKCQPGATGAGVVPEADLPLEGASAPPVNGQLKLPVGGHENCS
jgi:hypothetical protein